MCQEIPTVTIIFPVRNRALYLPLFLENLSNLDYPKSNISIISCINDSIDCSDILLFDFQKKYQKQYKSIEIYQYNLGTPLYQEGCRGAFENFINPKTGVLKQRNTSVKVYKNLARLRNSLFFRANKLNNDYIFSVDTDIMIKPETLSTLIQNIDESEYDFMSALICNGFEYAKTKETDPYLFTNIMKKQPDNTYTHITDYNNKNIIEVDLSGAIFCVSNQAAKIIKFSENQFGEDAGSCQSLQNKGFKLACNCQHKLAHCMNSELLEEYKKGNFVF